MSATLSDDEFKRLQNQLLELKNSNYTLEEKLRKQSVDSFQWKAKCENLEKDLSKYQNLAKLNPLSFAKTFQLNKGQQKEKELIDNLNEEKELYQKKLQIQEDEFKLTNDMLRQEIVNLMNEIKVIKSTNHSIVPKDDVLSSSRCNSFNSNESSDIKDDGEITLQLTPNGQRKTKMSYALLSEKEQLETSLDETTKNLNSIKEENEILKSKFNEFTNRNLKLEQNLKQLKETNSSYLNEASILNEEIESLKKELVNFKELADKRKSTIDELKCHIEDTSGKAELAIESANKKVNEMKASLNKELSLLKTEKKDFMIKNEELQKQLDMNKDKNIELEANCIKLNEENKELNNKVNELNIKLEDYESIKLLIEKLEDEKQKITLQLHDENELKVKELNELIESLKEQLNQKDSLIKKLRQDVEDQIEERKIHEKKGVMYVRELKKLVSNEKKIKERLQEKFGELQSEKSFEIGSKSFDTTSVGSWSFLSPSSKNKDQQNVTDKNNSTYSIHSSTDGNLNTNSTSNGINSPISDVNSMMTNGDSSPQLLEKENTELLSRLGKLQQEKWELEEKVNHILLTIEKLESELDIKQKIISYYCMDRRRAEPSIKQQKTASNVTDKFTVKKVVDFIKDKSDDNLKEINKKLQRMLEETLTKNMFLQNNLESLTDELQSLKKN